jgi:L-lactate dehydrogenase complex protein LldF
VNLGDQIYQWRQQLDDFGTANPEKKLMSRGMSMVFGSTGVYNTALKFAPLANYVPSALINCGLNPWSEGHKMMTFPKQSFHTLWKKGKVK